MVIVSEDLTAEETDYLLLDFDVFFVSFCIVRNKFSSKRRECLFSVFPLLAAVPEGKPPNGRK